MEQERPTDRGGDSFLHDGNYSVVVSNDFGSVTSTSTALQVDGTFTPWLRLEWK